MQTGWSWITSAYVPWWKLLFFHCTFWGIRKKSNQFCQAQGPIFLLFRKGWGHSQFFPVILSDEIWWVDTTWFLLSQKSFEVESPSGGVIWGWKFTFQGVDENQSQSGFPKDFVGFRKPEVHPRKKTFKRKWRLAGFSASWASSQHLAWFRVA